MPDIDKRRFTLGGAVDAVKDVTSDVSNAATSVTNAATAVSSVSITNTDADGSESSQLMTIDPGTPPTKSLVMDQWKNRERMAYIALFSMIIATAALYFIPDTKRIEQLAIALTWFYGAMGGIVAAFSGFRAWEAVKGK
jgi:hypothetical protein